MIHRLAKLHEPISGEEVRVCVVPLAGEQTHADLHNSIPMPMFTP
jgi:hypothetical protein